MLRDSLKTLDTELSRVISGHTVGLFCEMRGWRGNARLRRSVSAAARSLARNGMFAFRPELTPQDAADLVAMLDCFEAHRATPDAVPASATAGGQLVMRPHTVRLSHDGRAATGPLATMVDSMSAQLNRLLDIEIDVLGTTLYRNRATADLKSISADWHFDRRPTDWLRLFVYLSDVDDDCGPFHYFRLADSKRFVRRGFRRGAERWQAKVAASGCDHRLTGSVGSGLIVNAERLLHRAGLPREGRFRDMFELIFRPA